MGIIITILSVIIMIVLGMVVLMRDLRAAYARLFAALCMAAVVWVVTNQVANSTDYSLSVINLANKTAFAAGYSVILLGVLFSYFFPVRRQVSVGERAIVLITALLAMTASVLDPVVGIAVRKNGVVQFTSGEWIGVFVLLFLLTLGMLVRNLIFLPKQHSRIEQIQAKLFMAAFVISAVIGLMLNAILPALSLNFGLTIYGPLATVV